MKHVSALTETDQEALTQLYATSTTHHQRQRAQAVLLSAKGYTLEQITDVLGSTRRAVSGWLNRWQEKGLNGLPDAPKSGCPHKIDAALEAEMLDLLLHPTPDFKAVVQAHLKKTGITVSWSAVRRCLRWLGFTFRRARRVTAKSPCPKKQGRVQRALSRLHHLEEQNKCRVLYGDESRWSSTAVYGRKLTPTLRLCARALPTFSRRSAQNIHFLLHNYLIVFFDPLSGSPRRKYPVCSPHQTVSHISKSSPARELMSFSNSINLLAALLISRFIRRPRQTAAITSTPRAIPRRIQCQPPPGCEAPHSSSAAKAAIS